MQITPDWIPNIHPLVVHFPIALLVTAVLIDFFSLIFKQPQWLQKAGSLLYLFGGISVLVTYFTGKNAAYSVTLPALANPVLTEHADYALLTVWYYGIFALLRLGVQFKFGKFNKIILIPLFLAGLAGLFLLFKTAENGGKLVYKYGVGTPAVLNPVDKIEETKNNESPEPAIVIAENGSWEWQPDEGAQKMLIEQFTWLENSIENVNPEVILDQEKGSVLMLQPDRMPVMFVAGGAIKSIQGDVLLNVSEFAGTFMLIHHVQDVENFDFISMENGKMKLGRMVLGEKKIFHEKLTDSTGWLNVRVVGDGSHFRGYINEKLITHGHANELPPGPFGLRIEGTGTIYLQEIQVQSLR